MLFRNTMYNGSRPLYSAQNIVPILVTTQGPLTMSQTHDSNDKAPRPGNEDELEHILLEGLSLTSPAQSVSSADLHVARSSSSEDEKDKDSEKHPETDIQG